jgi:hypothetical protein
MWPGLRSWDVPSRASRSASLAAAGFDASTVLFADGSTRRCYGESVIRMVDSADITGRADIIFALPFRVRSASVLPGLSGWEAALTSLGVACLDDSEARGSADLLIAPGDAPPPGTDTPGVILEGRRAGRRGGASGYAWHRLVALPNVADPEVLLPVHSPAQVRYALRRSPPAVAWKRLRNRVIVPLLAAGVPPIGLTPSAVGARDRGPPLLVAVASNELGLPGGLEWVLFPAQGGDPLTRATFHLFPQGEAEPEWVLKFARVSGYTESFDRDERGLALAAGSGELVRSHAPRLLGRFAGEELNASVETAAVGQSLVSYLTTSADSRSAKLRLIEEIAEWSIGAGVETAGSPEELEPERRRLKEEVVPAWAGLGASASLVDQLPPLVGVMQHNDLGTWNIVVRPEAAGASRFTVLDWESARPDGMPLWDLWYFLYLALAELDGLSGIGEAELRDRERHAVALFRGELPSSEVFFRWTRRGVEACGVPADAVGALATLSFLHHGLSQSAREAAVREHAEGAEALEMLPPRLGRHWLSDPALGPGWDRWR